MRRMGETVRHRWHVGTTVGRFTGMVRRSDKTLLDILRGTADANISFRDLRRLLLDLGFEERTRGSHHIFRKPDIEQKIVIQKEGSKAKPYQVRQVRAMLVETGLGGAE